MLLLKKLKIILKSKDSHFISVDFKTYKRWKWLIKIAILLNKNYKTCEIYRSKFKSLENFVVIGLRYNGKNVRRRTSGWAKTFIKRNRNIKCIYCGDELNDENATADHIVPISKGGNNAQVNLVTCCKDCNLERGNLEFSKYIRIKNEKFKKTKYIKI
jgi:5-methylcytosine-specific restriction endonuclease McrA